MPSLKAFGVLLGSPPQGREAVDRARRQHLQGDRLARPTPSTRSALREIAGRSYDRGHCAAGVAAPAARDHRLRRPHRRPCDGVHVPATVIHGNRDPLVRPSGGSATARAIPGARLKIIDGMGHDLPRALWPTFVEEIADTAARSRDGLKQPV